MIIKKILIVVLAWFLLSHNVLADNCQNQSSESGQKTNPGSIGKIDLKQKVDEILAEISDANFFNVAVCHQYIDQRTSVAYLTPTSEFILPAQGNQEQSLEIINNLFKIRLALHEKLREFDGAGTIGAACVNSIREANQFIRFAEEYLMEWGRFDGELDQLEKAAGSPLSFLSVEKPHKMVNEERFGNNPELKTGDVLVIRGNANVSAMIARLGDEESIFSHSAIVGEDQDNKKYIVEALIPKGLIYTPVDQWLRETRDARVAVYRFNDEAMSQKAGRAIYRYAVDKGKTAPYDFAMDESDRTMFFCSEVAQYGYWLASDGDIVLPKHRTAACKLRTSTSFFDDMGIKTEGSLFSPADIEVDPRFELVLDFRDISANRLLQARRKDAVLQSIYQWMTRESEKDRYNFYSTPKYFLLGTFAKIVRQFGVGAEIFPKHIPFNTLQTLLRYEDVAKILLKNLEEIENNRKAGSPSLSFRDLMTANEQFREADCKKYYPGLGVSTENQAYGVVQPGGYFYLPVQNTPVRDTSEFHDFFRGTCSS